MFHNHNFAPDHHPAKAARREALRRLQGTMALFMAGIAVLGFLVAIDRPEWFHIRPATGTSIAMSQVTGAAPAHAAAQHGPHTR